MRARASAASACVGVCAIATAAPSHTCRAARRPLRPPRCASRVPHRMVHVRPLPALGAALRGCARVLARRTHAHGRSAAARGGAAAALHRVVGGCVLARLQMVATVSNGSVCALRTLQTGFQIGLSWLCARAPRESRQATRRSRRYTWRARARACACRCVGVRACACACVCVHLRACLCAAVFACVHVRGGVRLHAHDAPRVGPCACSCAHARARAHMHARV